MLSSPSKIFSCPAPSFLENPGDLASTQRNPSVFMRLPEPSISCSSASNNACGSISPRRLYTVADAATTLAVVALEGNIVPGPSNAWLRPRGATLSLADMDEVLLVEVSVGFFASSTDSDLVFPC
jgi:hypothetical protein